MKIIKKLFLVLIIFLAVFAVGCKKDDDNGNNNGNNNGNGNENGNGTIDDPVPDMKGQTFIIMVNLASTTDPRSEAYTGSWKDQKIAKIQEVEDKYNIKVEYRTYPAEAVWGGGRERFIIENSVNDTPKAHIYEMPSYSIAILAEAKAILPLDSLIEKYGNPGYWPEKAAFGMVMAATPMTVTAVGQIFYNIDLLEEYLGEGWHFPSELGQARDWTLSARLL